MKRCVLCMIAVLFVISCFVFPSTDAKANIGIQASSSDYRLPFVGSKNITEGPTCTFSHGGTEAIDFSNGTNFAVYSTTSGEVIDAYFDSTLNNGYSYGNLIKIKDASGNTSYYAHLSEFKVRKGERVVKEQLIGYAGNTTAGSKSMGIHLHFEVRDISNNPVSVRNLPGITWANPNQPCQPDGKMDGVAYGEPVNGGISLFPLDNYLGAPNQYNTPTFSKSEFAVMTAGSLSIVPGWSVKLYPDIFTSGQCINQSSTNLDLVYFYASMGVRAIEVFDNANCSPPPPFENLCPSQSSSLGDVGIMSIGSGCDSATPTPGPSPTPGATTTPLPPVGSSWTAKFFNNVDECKDNSTCNPSSLFKTTTVSGSNINLSFSDGKAFGTGGDTWGALLTQRITFSPGTYYFHVSHDDGTKVWLNGSNVMDLWGNNESQTTCPGKYLSGAVDVAVAWKNMGGSAYLNFYFDTNGSACQQQASEWEVKWYSDPNICSTKDCNPSQVYLQKNIQGGWFNVNYPDGKAFGEGNQRWGSLWKGTFFFPEGDYVFYADHDDGIKLFVGNANNGNAIMDVGNSENGNRACPAIHLSGNVPIAVIHKNEGGSARINVWWDTNTSACDPPPAGNVWVSKDTSDVTRVILENGNPDTASLYLARNGQPVEITKTRWTKVGNNLEAIIPSDVVAFLVDKGFEPIVDGGNADEWYKDSANPHWVVRKKMTVWIDELGRTHLSYFGDHSRPQIRFYTSGSAEQLTSSLWQELPDGSGIEAIIPDTYEAIKIDRWIRPVVESSASTWWVESNYWLPKRLPIVTLRENDRIRLDFYWGLPLPVMLGRYGQEVETRTNLWQSVQVDGHTNYFIDLPADVVAFEIQGGPKPRIDGWASWLWGNYTSGHWVSQKTAWVYKNPDNTTQVFYSNPDVNPVDVPVIYYNFGDSTQYQTTSWWTKVEGGLSLKLPTNIETFFLTRGPAPLLTDSVTSEWRVVSTDGKWLNHKWLRVWKDSWGKTYVTYWREQTLRPNIHYWLNGQEVITNTLWQLQGDGLQARLPDGAISFLIDTWNQPIIEASAQGTWQFSSLPNLWIELINRPTSTPTVTSTPTRTPTVTSTVTSTPTITSTPRPTSTPDPSLGNHLYLPIIIKP